MWQLSQMSHHQTSALLVTPVFIIHPMIIIMLITKCQYWISFDTGWVYSPPQKGKDKTRDKRCQWRTAAFSIIFISCQSGRDCMVPRVIHKAKSDLQPRFLLSILHLSNIFQNWLASSIVLVSTHRWPSYVITQNRNLLSGSQYNGVCLLLVIMLLFVILSSVEEWVPIEPG